MFAAAAFATALLLAGCRSEDLAQADGRMLWNSDGCAFYVQPGVGDTSFVKRIPDADRESCAESGR